MKKLKNKILWLIHHKTDKYIEIVNECPDLHYTEYRIYRIHKTLGFITTRRFEKYFTDLGDANKEKRAQYKFNLLM